jgi:hypothetical protein
MQSREDAVKDFFKWSDCLDYYVLRPLSHIKPNWEIRWNHDAQKYEPESDSFAADLNEIIDQLAKVTPPPKYHDHEDRLAEFVRDRLKWKIRKEKERWIGQDYAWILEQGGFNDDDLRHSILAASGRVHAAIARGQYHFDQMENAHQKMLAAVLANIVYHRECRGLTIETLEDHQT